MLLLESDSDKCVLPHDKGAVEFYALLIQMSWETRSLKYISKVKKYLNIRRNKIIDLW